MAKRKKAKPVKAEPQKKNKSWIIVAAIVIIALVAIFASMYTYPKENVGANQGGEQETGQSQQTPSTVSTGDICKRDLECFLANCKSNPNVLDCVNSTHQETYYKSCNGYTDVRVTQNFARCGCVGGICKIK